MSSRMTCELLTTRLSVAPQAVAPPIGRTRLHQWRVGRAAGPGSERAAHLEGPGYLGPASKIMPESLTPGTPSTCMAAVPFCGTRVGKPRPSTIVFGRLTTIGAFRA